jgi:cell division protein FtsB
VQRLQDLPEGLRAKARQLAELEKTEDELEEQIRKLTTDRAETEVSILKTVLERSAEGREWLAQIDDLRHAAQKRLNVKIDPKLLSGKV